MRAYVVAACIHAHALKTDRTSHTGMATEKVAKEERSFNKRH